MTRPAERTGQNWVLAIRTEGSKAELHLLDKDGSAEDSEIWQAGRELSVQILVKIQGLLKRNKVDFKNLAGIIVFKGPGSFTSLRIGISVANAMAYSLNIPIVGTSGNDWLRQSAKLSRAKLGKFVVPAYGAEPNITKPKR